ncbi:hypothetical protein C2E20_0427 [Micractinium conductrix]|uniref:Uncharacterized protein n=1 Tax=Micractinium conductrix TaxID=554055 RepID=A0A2P6VQS4_9CHLO|nr:hypothetical protein C2E20_0427 [Micractinium conductrix]|eukprot:PSC76448.1 hypothetical protein C2E20_0427 [Micractinium conductrix]
MPPKWLSLKYRALTGKLEAVRKGPYTPAGCMLPMLGYRALGDGFYQGAPAVLTPAKGAVWVQGYAYNVTFARSHAPTGQLAITLHQHTNCGDDGAPLYSFPLAAASLAASSAWVTLTTPDDVAGSGMFLQIAGSGGKNFSELFSIEPRTARTGWFSPFKPFDDCTAQWSPSPGAEPLAARGIALAATTPGATVVDSLCAGSPTSRECTVPCEASPEAGAAR